MTNRKLLKQLPNLGVGHDEAYDYIEGLKKPKAQGNFRLPKNRPTKTAIVTFGIPIANFENRTIDIFELSGVLMKTDTTPFASEPIDYVVALVGNERTHRVKRKQVLDFDLIECPRGQLATKVAMEELEKRQRGGI